MGISTRRSAAYGQYEVSNGYLGSVLSLVLDSIAHAKIVDVTLADHLFPLKPKIAVGQMIECPNCGKSATYKTINLTYRA